MIILKRTVPQTVIRSYEIAGTLSGALDGNNQVFTTEYDYASDNISVLYNGQALHSSEDFIESGANEITLVHLRPDSDVILRANYEHKDSTAGGLTNEHNELKNIQGGSTDEYYHLTSAQYNDLTSASGIMDASSQHIHDDRYYMESEVDTISGTLQVQIDAKPDTFLELDDTPTTYSGSEGKYISVKNDGTGLEFVDITTGSGNLVFTNTIPLLASGINYEGFSHNLNEQFVQATSLFKPTSGIYQGLWVNGENMLALEYYDTNTIRIYNEGYSDISIGDVKIVVDSGSTGGTGGPIIDTFVALSDTPSVYSGQADKYVKVKNDETGLEFGDEIESTAFTLQCSAVTVVSSGTLQLYRWAAEPDSVIRLYTAGVSSVSGTQLQDAYLQVFNVTDDVIEYQTNEMFKREVPFFELDISSKDVVVRVVNTSDVFIDLHCFALIGRKPGIAKQHITFQCPATVLSVGEYIQLYRFTTNVQAKIKVWNAGISLLDGQTTDVYVQLFNNTDGIVEYQTNGSFLFGDPVSTLLVDQKDLSIRLINNGSVEHDIHGFITASQE